MYGSWVCIAAMDRMWVQGTDRSLTFWAMANISHIIPKDCHRDGMRLLEARSTKAHWSIEEPCRLEQFFPECVARIPVSLWGSGGWGCVRSTLRLRSQPFAWGPYGHAYGKFCRRGPFWRFQTSRCFVSHGRRGTSWHSDVFCNVSKVVLCGRCHTFVTFS